MTVFFIPFLLAVAPPAADCHEIDNESVLARDVAPYLPGFANLPPDFLLGYVESSGAPKVFRGADLQHIARNRGVTLEGLDDLCLERRTFIVPPQQIRDAMQKTLGVAEIKIEILASSQQKVPTGEVIFERSGVQPPAGPEITWRGYVQSGKGAKFPIWAKARITATMNRVVAGADLQPGKPIQQDQIRIESSDASPFEDGIVRELNDVVGLVAKARILKASSIRKSQIEPPLDVASGDVVRVDVFAGSAHLKLEARAETGGMKGSTIAVRNLSTGKEFRAEVTGKDQVTVGGRGE